MTTKTPYLTSQQLAEELTKSQAQGNAPTVRLCEYFRLIASKLIGAGKYRNYPKALKEDLQSAALVKCIKNIKNFKPEYADKCFSYYTRCVETSFWESLAKHYRHINTVRQLMRDYASSIEADFPDIAKEIRDMLLEEDTTHTIKKGVDAL